MRSGISDLHIDIAAAASAGELANVAAATFPLACPPSVTATNVASFIAANLSAARFAEYLSDPRRAILAAHHDERIIGYAMLIRDIPESDSSAELSKIYVLPDFHGRGVAGKLMDAVLDRAARQGVRRVWLGVNRQNVRAQRFYTKCGFEVSGTRTFRLGDQLESDYLMARAISRP
ncbi:N-acetyltransferase [Mycobacterium intermedium]|uniref:N-acetyltransferase n=1 Tax=Mycobacterium intermedium TaxID=28445 RepID=A0A1E3SDX5_MYCIE|nr:GNAT family N-acetyltransferase [Mycobacterium intermedium]ODR00364.1 GNAT family N-acetyltransferase [Mycobacterium intermedium]OPE51069.1 N-acetyltransferase [Mycobacterium intermedium]ORB01757.1 N-acetyltransferase [Mycobacterium intermedium]